MCLLLNKVHTHTHIQTQHASAVIIIPDYALNTTHTAHELGAKQNYKSIKENKCSPPQSTYKCIESCIPLPSMNI